MDKGALETNGIEVDYALEHDPRVHWAYRYEGTDPDISFRSPFSNHSAEITEYWSFAAEARDRWLAVVGLQPVHLKPLLDGLGFPLDRLSDRVGNLTISGAADAIDCDLTATNNGTLILSVNGGNLLPDSYTATIWAGHSGDYLVRRSVAITRNETLIDLQSNVDHIGFALYRTMDGQCIDFMDEYLFMEINIGMHIETGPTLQLRDSQRNTIHRVNPWKSRSTINIGLDGNSDALYKTIRQEVLGRKIWEREAAARQAGTLERFGPSQFEEAVQYFLGLLSRHSHPDGPIYLADPYFMRRDSGVEGDQLYLGIFGATVGRPLRILCGRHEDQRRWWSNYPGVLTNHSTVRSFLTPEDRPAFHDRYLITPEREILITHSLNGWRPDGVTFASLPYGVYRAEAEKLWSMDIGVTGENIRVSEVN